MGDFETVRIAALVRQKVSLAQYFNSEQQWMLRKNKKVSTS